jgi:uncharacterized protein
VSTIAAPADTTDSRAAARRGLAIYFAVLILGSGTVETVLLRAGDSIAHHTPLIFLLMWMPAISSFVARAVRGEGIADVSFRFGGTEGLRMIGVAIAFPLLVGAISYGAAWATGLVGYTTPPKYGGFFPYLGMAMLAGPTLGVLSGAGEEIGWRGYMLTRLIDGGVPRPLLVSGLIWAAWHLPLILSGQYAAGAHPGLSAAIFVVDVVGIAYAIGIVRLRSGSVWPAAVMHGAWNAIIQGPFDRASTGPGATFWVGESGILVAVVSLVIGYCTMRLVSTGKSK